MRPMCSLQPRNVSKQKGGHRDIFAFRGERSQRRTFVGATMLMLLAVAACFPQSSMAQQAAAAGSPGGSAGQAKASMLIPTSLASGLDSKKLKTGDAVTLKVAGSVTLKDGGTLPRGAAVVGHVTEAKAKSKGDAQSVLAITFDKLTFPDGKSSVVSGMIRAVGPDLSAASDGGGGVEYSNNMSRTTYMPSVSAQPRAVPMLNEQSVGVVGIKNLGLDSDGVLSSDASSVKLDRGSQVLLQVEVPATVK
jgi:hypothetical protein